MAKKNLPKLTSCQNCETPTPGNYCPECGQDSRDHRVGLRMLVVGLWNDLFTFDSRFWHSFVLLLFKPGTLTTQYVAGRRARYIPPARLYLFISIVFFFTMSVMVADVENISGNRQAPEAADEALAQLDSLHTNNPGLLPEQAVAALDSLPEVIAEGQETDDGYSTGQVFGREFKLRDENLTGALINLAPKGMFLLLPIFALLLKLIFRRSRRMYIEHLIFSLHYHSFVFILLFIALITTWFWPWPLSILLFNIYLYLAMKQVYGQGWLKTWLKHFLLTGAYNIVFFVFFAAVAAGSIFLASWAEEYPKWLGWMVG
jgi:Protein of unknown function (DUF3667)